MAYVRKFFSVRVGKTVGGCSKKKLFKNVMYLVVGWVGEKDDCVIIQIFHIIDFFMSFFVSPIYEFEFLYVL